jgi:Protein of unknown function (DUF3106)
MLRRLTNLGFLAMALLLVSGASVHAQRNARVLAPPARRRVLAPGPGARAAVRQRAANLPKEWIEQLQDMRPAEQQRFLKNNERFRSLPPGEQALIRKRLRAWNDLLPEQRQALLERQQIWAQLPPDQRKQVRETLLPRWQSLPLDRRQVLLGKLRELRGLDADQRNAKVGDDSFASGLSDDERQMLRDLSNLGAEQKTDQAAAATAAE